MRVAPLSTTGTELKSSLYLPSVGFGFLLISTASGSIPELTQINQSVTIYLLGFILTLISAVLFHEFIESYSGPSTGLFEQVPAGRTYQSIGFTLYKTGEPVDYPERPDVPPWEYEVDIPLRRYFVVFAAVMLFLLLIVSYPYTTFELAKYSIQNSSLTPGAIAFAETVIMLCYILADVWPKTYRYWEKESESTS